VIGSVLQFLATWLLTWAVLMVLYIGLLVAIDQVTHLWHGHQRARQHRRAAAVELARIDAEAVASVKRINLAFAVAQRLIREHTEVEHQRRES
jgi:hypothetical protein